MSFKRLCCTVAVAALCALGGIAVADDAAKAPETSAPATTKGPVVNTFKVAMDLKDINADQQAKIAKLQAEFKKKMKDAPQVESPDGKKRPDWKSPEMQKLVEWAGKEIEGILTPEQKKEMEEKVAKLKAEGAKKANEEKKEKQD